MKKTNLKIYIDTNVVRDCTEGRNNESIHLIETLRDEGIKCVTSIFTLMELIDTKKEDMFFNKKLSQKVEINTIIRKRGNKDLNMDEFEEISKYLENRFFGTYKFIQPVNIVDDSSWKLALTLSTYSNMSAKDIIHLVVAWEAKCTLLVTSDTQFIKCANELLEDARIEKQLLVCDSLKALKLIKKSPKELLHVGPIKQRRGREDGNKQG